MFTNRNDEKNWQTGITIKVHTNHDGVWATSVVLKSIAACLRSSGDLPSSHWGKPQKLNRSHFEWTTKSLLWYPYRCVDQKATSVTAAEFFCAVISSNLYVPANSAVVHSWNTRFEQFFYHLSFKKSCVFLWFSIQPDFSEHFSLKFCTSDSNPPGKC